MKVVNSIKQLYSNVYDVNAILKSKVDELILSIKEKQWHYISRIKELESFALKLETSRVEDPNKLEDFFACTIVVENTKAIKKAKQLVRSRFKILNERPKSDSFTSKDSASFVFDDLRLYVTLKPTNSSPKGPINDVKFEIQIKTFLQHAWAIATHDLVYKSDSISWTRQRVAYQVKAMLETAEVSIEKAATVKTLPGIPTNNRKVQFQNDIKDFILKYFNETQLPNDIVRLISNIEHLLKTLNIQLIDVEKCLIKENENGKGTNTLNLSPYLILVQSIINQKPKQFIKFLKAKPRGNYSPKIFLPSELDTMKFDDSLLNDNVIRT